MIKYIAYYRASAKDQEVRGLDIKSQKYQVESYIDSHNIVKSFEEIENVKNKKRPLLQKAINLCINHGYTLVVANLDRLGKNEKHLTRIRENLISGNSKNLLIIENPNISTLEFFFYVQRIQNESKKISIRTKTALAAKKRQGIKLGSPKNLTYAAKMKGCKVRKEKARTANKNAYKQARDMRNEGKSYRYIANKLNEYGVCTSRGGKFYPTSVKNLLELFV